MVKIRKPFNTSIEEKISKDFKEKCKTENLPMNVVLEMLMRYYCEKQSFLKIDFKE